MKDRMQKTSAFANDCPQRNRTESEWIHGDVNRHELTLNGGVQTFMWITEDNIVEVPFVSRMESKIGTAVCRTARMVV